MILLLLLAQDIPSLIEDLGHENLDRREAAMQGLEKRIKEAMPALRKAAKEAGDLDVRAGAQSLLNKYSAGAVLWKHECTHKSGLIQPLRLLGVQGDLAVVECGCFGSPLVALDEATGKIRWESNVGAGYATYSSLAKGVVFATINTGPDKVAAVDLATGKTRWTFEGKKGLHRPVLAGTRAIVGGGDGVRAVDAETGKILWHFETKEWIPTPGIFEDLLIGRGLRVLDLETGTLRWQKDIGPHSSPVAVAKGVICVGAENRLFAFRLDGSKVWECEVEGIGHDAPVIVGDQVRYTSSFLSGKKTEGGGYPTITRCYTVELGTGKITGTESPAVAKSEVRTIEIDGMSAELPATFSSKRYHTAIGGFPVLSGERYTGPRRSAVVCLRGVDVDQE